MASQAAAVRYASYGAGTAVAGGYYETSPRKVAVPAGIPSSAPPVAIPERRPAVRTAAKARPVVGVSLFAIFGGAFVAVLMFFVVLAHINYIAVTNDAVRLEARLSELATEGKKLEIAYEQAFDMDAVGAYATGVLGMVKPDAGHLVAVDAAPRDRAVILEDEGTEGGGLGSFLSSLLSYLN